MQESIQNIKNEALAQINEASDLTEIEQLRITYLGRSGKINRLFFELKNLPEDDKKRIGLLINQAKNTIETFLSDKKNKIKNPLRLWFDPTIPGKLPQIGHLHLVTQAIEEIADVFKQLGFVRVRYPEVEWDYFAFEALNMPLNHPARDEWETFFIDQKPDPKYGKMLLTPHTSSGQIREMLRVKIPPIRMINIAKCYRRQSDVNHYPMFHQFEGLVVDKNITIANLKGTIDYFVKSFFGSTHKIRIRPYHFQFTEPSFEIDVDCALCAGGGCKFCKAGWLELGGAGMVHPNVLNECGINPKLYSGFAFGWGVERTYMMKSGIKIPDLRLLYSSDINYLKQF